METAEAVEASEVAVVAAWTVEAAEVVADSATVAAAVVVAVLPEEAVAVPVEAVVVSVLEPRSSLNPTIVSPVSSS